MNVRDRIFLLSVFTVLLCAGFDTPPNVITRDMFFGKWRCAEYFIRGDFDTDEIDGMDSVQYWFRADSTFSYTFNNKEREDTSKVSGTWIYNQKDKRIEITWEPGNRLYMYFISYIDADSISMINSYSYGKETEIRLRRVK